MATEENPDFTSYAHIDPDNPSHWASFPLYMENVGPSNTPFRSPPNRALEALTTAEGSPSSSSSPFSQFTGPFRFLDLPSELRVVVYTYLLPYDRRIWFDFTSLRNSQPEWKTRCVPKPTGRFSGWADRDLLIHSLPAGRRSQNAYYEEFSPLWSLFLVNKHISSEARAILYGSNTFKLRVNGSPHKPISLQSSLIFGPLGLPHRLHLLRDLRHIELEVMIDETDHWVVKRHRGRLEHFVNIIKQHADDKDQRSLLKYLKVRVLRDTSSLQVSGYIRFPLWENISGDPQYTESFMFALESLAALQGIEDVEITGVMPWFAQCLELRIRGVGGEVLETDWPLVEVKRRRTPSSKKTAMWITTRKWHQPMLNWKEFAERNEIAVPEDIEKYWASA